MHNKILSYKILPNLIPMQNKSLACRNILLPCLLLLLVSAGCKKYSEVSSRESLDLIKQLYTACNTKNEARLNACEKELEQLRAEGKVSDRDLASFHQIIELGKQSSWDKAQTEALQFAQDQVR